MVGLAAIVVLAWLTTAANGAEPGCIPDRCNAAEFNNPVAVAKRSVDEDGVKITDTPQTKNKVIKSVLKSFVRPRHELAKLYSSSEESGGIPDKWMVTLFNYDKEGKFARKYSKIIKENIAIGKKDASMFVVEANKEMLKELCNLPEVAYLEQLKRVKMHQVCRRQIMFDFDQNKWLASWGLTRIDQRKLPFDNFYYHDAVNSTKEYDVFTYVVDTGVAGRRTDQFGDRLIDGIDLTDSSNPFEDIDGHGTHVAGTLGSSSYGVAKNVKIIPVRVTPGLADTFPISVVIRALNWISEHVERYKKENKSVVNLSLGSNSSLTVNTVVNSMVEQGITVVAAAGNEAIDSCCSSPASATSAITVACSDPIDDFCSFSNWGPCVDLIAPGTKITSVNHNGFRSDPLELSGTSMSAPHVSGAAAVLIARNGGMPPKQVKSVLVESSSKGEIMKIPHERITENRLVFTRCEE